MCDRRYKLGEKFKPEPDSDDRCDSCGTEVAILQVYDYPPFHPVTQELPGKVYDRGAEYDIEQVMILCDFCASTFCSKGISYPRQIDPDIAHTMAAVAFSHNAIMAELTRYQRLVSKAFDEFGGDISRALRTDGDS